MKATRPRRKPVKRAPRKRARRVEPILVARDLVKEYRSDGSVTKALDGVTIDVDPGSFTAVMGPSGSGKSTLLHLLGGLDSPTSGDVLLEGKPLSGLADKEVTLARRGTVGFVFQFFNLVPVLSVAENIALPLVIAGTSPDGYRARLDEVIEQVGLTDCADKLPSQVSGGQHQRTAIARAILPSPAVVLADEPTGNLDTRTGQQILQLLKDLQQQHGQTIVIVTHDPRAAAFGEEVIYLEDGRVRSNLSLSAKGGEARAKTVLAWLQKLGA
ncbi:MAG TPA: ABC transporter ATP-binding protein [Actinomycetota bacterium]|nr:ABC transporter ATP-binding protein [Actinomycetota bacterium]